MRVKPKKNPLISIVIPIEHKTDYLMEALSYLDKQTYQRFEVIISSTRSFSVAYDFARVVSNTKLKGNVAMKRNSILTHGRGDIYVFHDDDVFVPENYLSSVVKLFKKRDVLAAAGPLMTPLSDSFMQRASGAVWESYLGSEGAGTYRSRPENAQTVYDFPAANLVVRKDVFKKTGGFESGMYPGEDTKWCLILFNLYKKGIWYDPKLTAFHHRKALFIDHMRQIGRYGHQRGWFALSYPETSFYLPYFLPSLFLLYCILLIPLIIFFWMQGIISGIIVVLFPAVVYAILLTAEFIQTAYRSGILIGLAVVPGIVVTHWYYGYRFLKSFISKFIEKSIFFMNLPKRI